MNEDHYLYMIWLKNRPYLDATAQRMLHRLEELYLTAPAKIVKSKHETIDLLVKLLLVAGHILWLSLDDTQKRFALIEL